MILFTPPRNRFVCLLFSLFLSVAVFAQPWTNGQPGNMVLGQSNFTNAINTATATGMGQPTQVIVDPVTSKVFVADWLNSRILRFPNYTTLSNGSAAEAVFGQIDMISSIPGTAADGLALPMGICLDGAGNLWVADQVNNRVLRFNNAASMASGAPANAVLGQPDMVSSAPGTTATTMSNPASVFVRNDTLWVSDAGNHRVLRFNKASLKANGAAADGVLGQPDFVTATAAASAVKFDTPKQIYANKTGDLWVADYNNNRVMKFADAANLPPGAAASVVIGQTNFSANTASATASGFSRPVGVYQDAGGRLYISAEAQARILVYENATTLAIGASASYVLGQTNFTSTTPSTTSATFNSPQLLFTNDRLWVADGSNSRIVMYTAAYSLPLRLTGFKARWQTSGEQALITWTTAEESNVSHYELQYCTDGASFKTTLNSQVAKGNISNTYSYVHNTTLTGNIYYRLIMVDVDGSAVYSPVITIKNNSNKVQLSLYPNPVKDQFMIRASDVQQVQVRIYDQAGRLVKSALAVTLQKSVDVKALPAGIYTVQIQYDGQLINRQLVK